MWMNILRILIGMVGALVCFVSLLNVWMTWLDGHNTSFHWTVAFIGAFMWLQSVPIMWADERERRRDLYRKLLKGEKD